MVLVTKCGGCLTVVELDGELSCPMSSLVAQCGGWLPIEELVTKCGGWLPNVELDGELGCPIGSVVAKSSL